MHDFENAISDIKKTISGQVQPAHHALLFTRALGLVNAEKLDKALKGDSPHFIFSRLTTVK